MTKFFRDFVRDESGASAAEYALILAIVGAGIGGAALALGTTIDAAVDGAETKVENCTAGLTGSGTATSC
jgi:pilus assembly protein Flp/PilA